MAREKTQTGEGEGELLLQALGLLQKRLNMQTLYF